MSRSLKSLARASDYSKTVLPPGWRGILIGNEDGLLLFGRANLSRMLEDWKILSRAYTRELNFFEKYPSSESPLRNKEIYMHEVEASKRAIETISRVLPKAEEKPIFSTHRNFDGYLKEGDKAFVVVAEDGSFTLATVLGRNADKITLRFDEYEGEPEGSVEYNSPLLLSIADLCYLAENKDYARFFASGSDFRFHDDIELFLNMLEDCYAGYYSEPKEAETPRDMA
jgi:hypothetical protein